MSTQPYRVLVTGATGKQGGALIRALLAATKGGGDAYPSTTSSGTEKNTVTTHRPLHVVALTRNPTSPSSQRLSSHPSKSITVLQGDLSACDSVFREAVSKFGPQPFDGLFSVQVPLKPKVEEAQGKALVAEAIKHGVRRFVYTSADRGVDGDSNPTKVEHFRSKFNIEQFLRAEVDKQRSTTQTQAGGDAMQYTIIRPVAFMENLTANFLGRAFQGLWDLNGADRKLKLVSSEDVGKVAAQVFLDSMDEETDERKVAARWDGKAINLAGDELSPSEARAVFQRVVGSELPTTYPWLARVIKFVFKKQLGDMFDFFVEEGFGADVKACQEQYDGLQTFETWLRTRSAWKVDN